MSTPTRKPNHTRADRLHAIWQRRVVRFRDAHYAYRLADEHAERVGRDHPTYQQARDLVRRALRESHKLRLAYRDANGQATERVVRPLALAFYGPVWTLAAWCELREDFRNFRVDRIAALEMTPDTFAAEPGRTLEEYVRRLEAEPPAPHM